MCSAPIDSARHKGVSALDSNDRFLFYSASRDNFVKSGPSLDATKRYSPGATRTNNSLTPSGLPTLCLDRNDPGNGGHSSRTSATRNIVGSSPRRRAFRMFPIQ